MLNTTQGLVEELKDDVHLTINTFKIELGETYTKLNVTYRVVVKQPINPSIVGYRIAKIPESWAYEGARDGKELENFIFVME